MGERKKPGLRLNFNRKLKLEFHGAKITSDAGLLACREMPDGTGLKGLRKRVPPNYSENVSFEFLN